MTAPTALGTFAVTADRAAVDAFRAATGGVAGGADGAVPATFPMRWLTQADIRPAILSLLPEPDLVPVHESQAFDYAAPLEAGAPYLMTLSGSRSQAPDRLNVHASVADAAGAEILQLDTVLRLVAVPAAAPA